MMNPTHASSIAPARPHVRAAFAALAPAQQRLLEVIVFDGGSCTELAQALGGSASSVRQQAGAAMLALHQALVAPRASGSGDRGGAVAMMLALRALDALDADEAELVDTMLLHQPVLQRAYDDHLAVVGELCTMVQRIAPSPHAGARLCSAIDDDALAN